MREFQLFVYDAAMSGLPGAGRLEGAKLVGAAATEPGFALIELEREVALVADGAGSVRGEVYTLEAKLLASLDVEKGHPLRYRRARVRLADGREVDAYTLDASQVRGKRRIASGDYRAHSAPAAPGREPSAWSRWAKSRSSR